MDSKSRPSMNPLYWKWTWSTMNRPEFSRTSKPTWEARAVPESNRIDSNRGWSRQGEGCRSSSWGWENVSAAEYWLSWLVLPHTLNGIRALFLASSIRGWNGGGTCWDTAVNVPGFRYSCSSTYIGRARLANHPDGRVPVYNTNVAGGFFWQAPSPADDAKNSRFFSCGESGLFAAAPAVGAIKISTKAYWALSN